jgi:hypothetical protein
MTITIKRQVHFRHGQRKQKVLKEGSAPKAEPKTSISRVSRLMALAIHMQELINSGEVTDYAELARITYVTRARITQIMNLSLLAPDIQEELLHLPPSAGGRDPVRERMIRPVAGVPDWRKQRKMWEEVKSSGESS